MLRAGFSRSSTALLSRQLTSSKKYDSSNLIRHFVSTDVITPTNDRQPTATPSHFKVTLPLYGAFGATLSQNQLSVHNNGTFTLRRNFSSISDKVTACASSSPDAEIAKFEQAAAAVEAVTAATEVWEPSWWPQDHMLQLIVNLHDVSGMNYAVTIGALTLAFRVAMVPLFVKAQQNSSRMAHLQPEMAVLKEKIDRVDPKDTVRQQQYSKQMQDLFRKYDCNPLKSLLVPLVQMPIFMSMFFALRQMPDVFPEKLVDGGIWWFVDLNAPDPYYILPVTSALTFLAMMEMMKTQMTSNNPAQGQLMLTFFRALAVLMVPMTINFSTAIFCYWTTNNTFSLVQSAAFNNVAMKKQLGIWEPPKPVPGAAPAKGMKEMFDDMMKNSKKGSGKDRSKEKIQMHNAAVDKNNSDQMIIDVGAGAGRKRKKGRGKKA